jgi:hypothetical protein
MATKANNTVTFKSLLERSKKELKDDKSIRIAKTAKYAYDAKIAGLEKEIFILEDKIESLVDNFTITSIEGFNADSFVRDRMALKKDLMLKNKELEILKADAEFYDV